MNRIPDSPRHEPSPDTSRRDFLTLLGVGALTAVASLKAGFGPQIRQAIHGPDFSEQELHQVASILHGVRSAFPHSRYGHINLPLFVDDKGKIRIQVVGTGTADGWDCFDSSVELAARLDQGGFQSGVAKSRDQLGLFGIHFFPYIEKNGTRYGLDVTPPYYHQNQTFQHESLDHQVLDEHLYRSTPFKTKRVIGNTHPDVNPTLISRNIYPVTYLEKHDPDGVRKGYLYAVSFEQEGEMPGIPLRADGTPIHTYVVVFEQTIAKHSNGVLLKKTGEYPYLFDPDESRLVQTGMWEQGAYLEGSVYEKAVEVGAEYAKKIKGQATKRI